MHKQEEVEGKAMVQKYQFLMAGPSHQAARTHEDRRVEPCPSLYYGNYPVRPSRDFGSPTWKNARRKNR